MPTGIQAVGLFVDYLRRLYTLLHVYRIITQRVVNWMNTSSTAALNQYADPLLLGFSIFRTV